MKFAKLVFWCAGLGGVLGLTPLYFILHFIDLRSSPPVSQPVFWLSGRCPGLALRICLIGTDPVRFRPMMAPVIFRKFVFVATVLILAPSASGEFRSALGCWYRFPLGFLFVASFFKTPPGELWRDNARVLRVRGTEILSPVPYTSQCRTCNLDRPVLGNPFA